ncbi:MAG: UDP-3-O-(3-hydroxymyristoyl)glucosamine N-acyltransferase [Pseudomonadota bacterium]
MPVDFNFHPPVRELTLKAVAEAGQFQLPENLDSELAVSAICQADEPVNGGFAFLERLKPGKLIDGLETCAAVLCAATVHQKLMGLGVKAVSVESPRAVFQDVLTALFPDSLGNCPIFADDVDGVIQLENGARVSKTAKIEADVHIGAFAVIGDDVEIGKDTRIGPNSVVARQCKIGRSCDIGDNVSIQYALIGDRVVLASGVRLGQEGFGFVPRHDGLRKMPQLGRVILQDHVEIGANTCVDRGALSDTSIGQGTKIDNLVQIGHNVQIGVSTVIAGHAGLSGSVKVGNFCMLGGRVSVADHLTIGDRVQIAGTSNLMNDIPAGERWGGSPAVPMQEAFRQYAALRKLTAASRKKDK